MSRFRNEWATSASPRSSSCSRVPQGERLVRFAYSTDGVSRRGPVTLRARDVERLHTALEKTPELAQALGLSGGEA